MTNELRSLSSNSIDSLGNPEAAGRALTPARARL